MANTLKQPCIFPDLTAAPVPYVPDKSKSLCCGCDIECDDLCPDIGFQHKLIAEDPCLPCVGARIEFKWGTPPVSLTGLLRPGATLHYQLWRTRKLKNNDPSIPADSIPDCPQQPTGFTSRGQLLYECEADFQLDDRVADITYFASDPPIPDKLPGPSFNSDMYFAGTTPEECTGIMPNFVLVATDVLGGSTIELARCHLCPLTPTGTNAWRKPMICHGAVCCPDADALPGAVTLHLDGSDYTLARADGATVFFYEGAEGEIHFPDHDSSGTISLSCTVVHEGDLYRTRWVLVVISDDTGCFGSWVAYALLTTYTLSGGDCGFENDVSVE